ncbi:hypothetical protein TNCV_2568101 [Trichonephila clavipes]|uniref:Uncharacterized protein n=1 Tax=Trichonephila clavipes TaxID=2585209 RepID=A0A8X6WKM4_TRICX|nr:hypothetical protein TNCV_2568101 [Trichonephila clavipes]
MMGSLLPSSERNLNQPFWVLGNKDYHVDAKACSLPSSVQGRLNLKRSLRAKVITDSLQSYHFREYIALFGIFSPFPHQLEYRFCSPNSIEASQVGLLPKFGIFLHAIVELCQMLNTATRSIQLCKTQAAERKGFAAESFR